jgi:ferritin-like metal-binding protein YciE
MGFEVEHYEIASYGTARNWAIQLGLADLASLLQQTLDEEKRTDKLLTEIGEGTNTSAATAA